jgi:hypothetical protein
MERDMVRENISIKMEGYMMEIGYKGKYTDMERFSIELGK